MLVRCSSIFGRLLSGLGCTALLYGAGDALGMGPAVALASLVMTSAWMARWRQREALVAVRAPVAPERMPAAWLARLRDTSETRPTASAGRLLAFPDQRTFWSRVKVSVGSLGLLACGLWWMLFIALMVMPDPATALDELFTTSFLSMVLVSLLLPVLFLVFLRSGLRGPKDPFVPDWHTAERADDAPVRVRGPRAPSPQGKKSHLRLVRDTTL